MKTRFLEVPLIKIDHCQSQNNPELSRLQSNRKSVSSTSALISLVYCGNYSDHIIISINK